MTTLVLLSEGKQHKASYKGPKFVEALSANFTDVAYGTYYGQHCMGINHKTYCLVVTDDFSRCSWVFFLVTKSETSEILKKFITEIENQLNHKKEYKTQKCERSSLEEWFLMIRYGAQRREATGWTIICSFGGSFPIDAANLPHDHLMPELEDTAEIQSTGIFGNAYDDHDLETLNTPYADQSVGAEADFNNMEPSTVVSPIPITRVHSIHPKAQIIGDPKSAVEAMQEELLQFKIQKVWTLVDLPSGKKAIGFKEQSDIYGFASSSEFSVYSDGWLNAFLMGNIKAGLVYVCQPPETWYETLLTIAEIMDLHRDKLTNLSHNETQGDILLIMHNRFQMSSMGELTFFLGLQVKKKENGIFISQDKYVGESEERNLVISSVRTASTPMETNKALTKDEDGEDVDVHLYRSMIGSLMYLTSSRPDIMFSVCACSRFQVRPKVKNDYAGASLDRKSTTGGCQFLGSRFNFLVASIGKRGRDTKIPQSGGPPIKVGDEAVHKELGDRMERAATTASSFEAEQDSDAQTRFEAASKSPMTHLSQELTHLEVGRTKSEGSEGFHQIIDFLNASHIQYALTENPTIYVSFIKQFWRTATARTSANGEVELTATIDGQVKTITEASLRRHLKLEDNGGVTTLPNSEIFEQLALMGYVTDSDKLTFQKGHFSPQWRFLIHTILHCLSPKKTAWEQFSSNIATAIICLATNRTYNFSKLIFDAMIKNLENPHKFLMYPRFLQICFNKQRRLLGPHTRTYVAHTLTQKLFSNMKRISKGYSGVDIPLFPTMLTAPESSPSRITSSPSLSPQTHPSTSQQPPTPPFMQTIHDEEEPATLPHESPLQSVHSLGRDEGSVSLNELTDICTSISKKVGALDNELQQTKKTYSTAITKLIYRVKKLEQKVKTTKARQRARIVLSEDEEDVEDSSKHGRKISAIDKDPTISLVQPEQEMEHNVGIVKEMTWFQDADAAIKEKNSVDTKIILEEEHPTKLVEDITSGEKGASEVSTVNIAVTTAKVSTAAENLKTKKQLEQERLRHEEAVRLQEQLNEEETQRISRDAKIARQLHEEINKA
ncbi:hypothetical protein Tco_0520223 [Tanacetum coccineum]